MSISLKAMAYFTAALRHGNIAKAGAELNIAPSAIGAAIDQVESAMGLTLVTRQRARGIQPTAAGRVVAQKFERLLEDYRAVLAEGADLRQSLTGSLRIGYYAPVAPAFLPAILSRFLQPGHDVRLHLEECDNDRAQDGLLGGAFDAILFVSEGARPSVSFKPLIAARPYCLLPAGHKMAKQGAVTLAQIAAEPLVVLNRPVAAAYYQSLLDGRECATPVAYANSTEMVRSLVGAGHGCAILNMRPAARVTYGGAEVVEVPIQGDLPGLTLSVGYDTARPRRLVQAFADACRAYFADPEADPCVIG